MLTGRHSVPRAVGAVCLAVLGLAALGLAALNGMALGAAAAEPAAAAPGGFVLRDDLQHDVSFARSPRRIISMLPSLTETVCALGECARLVATDRFSNWPVQVNALPKAGGLDDASVEAIVSMRPDLILMSHSQRLTERLHELGIATFAVKTETYADIGRTVRTVGRILGVPERAAALVQRIDAEVATVAASAAVRGRAAAPTVYYEVDGGPYAAGPDSFIGELLTRLQTRNIVSADLGPYPRLNPEYVVRHDPDVMFVSAADADRLATRPGWDQLRAVRERRLCAFTPEVHDTIVRPGPRVPDGMRALEDCLERVAP